jgi:hypothetical protein
MLNKKGTALAGTIERRKERKRFCGVSVLARFHTAWTLTGIKACIAASNLIQPPISFVSHFALTSRRYWFCD